MKKHYLKTVLAALFLAIALVLPLLTGQIREIGNKLCPMHLPVLLCGFICGPVYGAMTGFIAPLLRFAVFGMPPIMPNGIPMCFELATYGLVSGLLYSLMPKKKSSVYISLIAAMLSGRIIWGIVKAILFGLGKTNFGLSVFITEGFVNSAPGAILQIILIPILLSVIFKVFPQLKK